MKKYLFILLLIIVGYSLPSHAVACGLSTSSNITCVQIIPLGGGTCGVALNSFITVTNAGDRLFAWTDTNVVGGWSGLTDQKGNAWTKVVPAIGWDTAITKTVYDTLWTTIANSSGALNITPTCPGGGELIVVEFHSSVGTVGIDCASNWTAFDPTVAMPMTSTCTSSHINDFGVSWIDWDSVNPSPNTGWIAGTNDTEDGSAFKALGAAGTVTSFWGGDPLSRYTTMVSALFDGSGPLGDVYIGQSAAGAGDGSSCANQKAFSFFNTAGNWGVSGGQIGANTRVHICGTITGTAGTVILTFQGGGGVGTPVTLLFEPGAVLTSPVCSQSGCIRVSGVSNVVIDGGTNGVIQNTANGSGLANETGSNGVVVVGSTNVTVQHLTISNLCQHTSTSDNTGCGTSGVLVGEHSSADTNILVTRNTIHDTFTGIFLEGVAGDSGIVASYNTISRMNWGFGQDGTENGYQIIGNDVSCIAGSGTCNWDSAADSFHHNGIIVFPQNADTSNNIVIANNYFHDINGNFGGTNNTTSFIFFDALTFTNIANALVYNNLFVTTTGLGPANAITNINSQTTQVYNNTVIGAGQSSIRLNKLGKTENNIGQGAFFAILTDPTITGSVSNFNDWFGWTGFSFASDNQGANFSNLADWQSRSTAYCSGGCDAGSISTAPGLNANFVPISGSSAVVGKGVNLTSLGIAGLNIGAPQFFGVNYACGTGCVARPSAGNWTIGAYQLASGPSFTASPLVIPSRHGNNIAVTLTGTLTTWSGSTAFSISGVTGAVLVSKSNVSATSETLQITTGAGTGTLTITDTTDSISATITVSAGTLSVSPSLVGVGKTPTITLTGTNTLWTTETAATLFGLSGGTGASIGTPTVTSNTSATAALTVGSSAGTETVTDNSTTAAGTTTAAFAVAPTCDHITGTYTGSFSNKCSTTSAAPVILCWSTTTTPVTNGLGTGCTAGTVLANNGSTTISVSENFNIVAGTNTLPDSSVTTYAYTITALATGGSISFGAKISNGAVIK